MTWILFFAVAWATIIVAGYVQGLLILRRTRNAPGKFSACRKDDIPKALLGPIAAGVDDLRKLGFRAVAYIRFRHPDRRLDQHQWGVLMVRREDQCCAEVINSLAPDYALPLRVVFWSFLKDGRSLRTFNGQTHANTRPAPENLENDAWSPSTEGQLRFHLQSRASLDTAEPVAVISPDEVLERMNAAETRDMESLVDDGLAVHRDDHIQFGWKECFRMVRNFRKGLPKAKKLAREILSKPSPSRMRSVDLSRHEAYAHLCMDALTKGTLLSGWGKLLVMLVSLSVFMILFGMNLSLATVGVLIAVLLFHEFGHLLAMWAFGYRDLQVLFLPIGAAAIGKKEEAGLWQKLIVYLAGPVPGLVLAGVLVWAFPGGLDGLLYDVVFMLIFLNLFNLLPVMPLDGGQIVNLLLFDRHPRLRIVFFGAATILFALAAYWLSEPVLGLLTIAMVFQTISALTLSKVDSAPLHSDSPFGSLVEIYRRLRHPDFTALRFPERRTLALQVKERLQSLQPTMVQCVGGLVIYAAAFAAPIVGILDYWQTAFLDPEFAENLEEPDWDARLAAAADQDERARILVEAGQWYLEIYDPFTAESYFEDALAVEGVAMASPVRADAMLGRIQTLDDEESNENRARQWLTELEGAIGARDARVGLGHLHIATTFYVLDGAMAHPPMDHLEAAIDLLAGTDHLVEYQTALTIAANYYDGLGDDEKAEATYRALVATENDEDRYMGSRKQLAQFLVSKGDMPGAADVLAEGAKNFDPEKGLYGSPYLDIAYIQLEAGQLDEARRTLDQEREVVTLQVEAMKDEMGWMPMLMGLDDQLETSTTMQFDEAMFVLSVRTSDWKSADTYMDRMFTAYGGGEADFKRSLAMMRRNSRTDEISLYSIRSKQFIDAYESYQKQPREL